MHYCFVAYLSSISTEKFTLYSSYFIYLFYKILSYSIIKWSWRQQLLEKREEDDDDYYHEFVLLSE